MKHLLKFLIPIILVAATFISCAVRNDSNLSIENHTETLTSDTVSHYIDSPTAYSDLNLPRQISGTNTLRLHNVTKRTNSLHRNNFLFTMTGKLINAGIGGFIQKESLNMQYSFTKPIHRLISFGKLII